MDRGLGEIELDDLGDIDRDLNELFGMFLIFLIFGMFLIFLIFGKIVQGFPILGKNEPDLSVLDDSEAIDLNSFSGELLTFAFLAETDV